MSGFSMTRQNLSSACTSSWVPSILVIGFGADLEKMVNWLLSSFLQMSSRQSGVFCLSVNVPSCPVSSHHIPPHLTKLPTVPSYTVPLHYISSHLTELSIVSSYEVVIWFNVSSFAYEWRRLLLLTISSCHVLNIWLVLAISYNRP